MSARMVFAEVHNARVCTFDGRDYFVASFRAEIGARLSTVEVEGFATLEEGLAWIRSEAARRDLEVPAKIAVRAGDPGTPIVYLDSSVVLRA